MTKYVAVLGTWGVDAKSPGDWYKPTSQFAAMLRTLGLEPLNPVDPFVWSGDINGAPWRRWFGWLPGVKGHHFGDWLAGGKALRWYVDDAKVALLAHSHGGWVALHACAEGLKVPVLATFGTPVRKDLDHIIAKARPNIGYWVHFYDPSTRDLTQWAGTAGDLTWSLDKVFDEADLRVPHRFGHSQLLTNPQRYELWRTQGLADLIRKLVAESHPDDSSSSAEPRPAA